jgi:dolichol-phosphate mannosyltransferase
VRKILLRVLRFASVGSMGTALQLVALATLTGPAGLHYLVATALAVEAAILHNFLWHDRWTWADRRSDGKLGRLLRFNTTTGLVSILGNLAFMQLFVGELGIPVLAGNLASIACCASLNFLLSDRVVFV